MKRFGVEQGKLNVALQPRIGPKRWCIQAKVFDLSLFSFGDCLIEGVKGSNVNLFFVYCDSDAIFAMRRDSDPRVS